MQKKILSMILAIAMVVSLFAGIAVTASAAETITLSFAGGDKKNYDPLNFSDEASGVTVQLAKNTHSSAPYWAADHVRFYGTDSMTNIMTVSAPAGYNITGITFTMTESKYTLTSATADSGAIAGDSWSGSANAVVFTSKGQLRMKEAVVTIEATGGCVHANVTSETTTAPSCTEAGVITITCTDCTESWTEAVNALGHEWSEEIITEAKCTTDGLLLASCNREGCDATEERVIPATGHDFTNGDCTCGEPAPVLEGYVKTELANIAANSEVIITMTNADGVTYALSSAKGNTAAPTAVAVEVAGDIISTADEALVWNITNVEGTLTIRPNGDAENALYCTNTNNGVRVGTNTDTAFVVEATYGYLFHVSTSRYVGVYNNADWRCYTTTPVNNNIKGQTLAFFVKSANEGGEGEKPEACEHAEGTYTCNEDGTHSFLCASCNQTIVSDCAAEIVEAIDATCNAYGSTSYECAICGGEWTIEGTEYGAHAWDGTSCTVCGATRNVYVKVEDPSALADGSGIVIYYPAKSLLLSGTANGTKLNGVAAVAADGTVYAPEGGELFLIVRKDANGDFYFETEDGKYLTTSATGNSLTLEESITDYAKWYFDTTGTVATLRIVNRNASYTNSSGTFEIALEYYNGITAYSIKDTEIYNFEVYQREGFSAHTHVWGEGEVTTEASCTADGVKTYTCACGDTMTEAIPAIGHNFSEGDTCANCPASVIKGQYTATIADGDTIIIYNPASNMALTNTVSSYYLAGSAAVACGTYVIKAAPEAAVWTVEIVDAEAGTFRLKTADGIYLQTNSNSSFTNSATLAAEGETDYSVWTLIDGMYIKSIATNKAIEYYSGKWTTYGLSTTNTAFNLKIFKTNVESLCEHNYIEDVVSTPDCTTDGVSNFECELCHDTYTTTVAATGHSYEIAEQIDADCTTDGLISYECTICFEGYEETIPATGHVDADLSGSCDICDEPFEYDIWELSTTAPTAGNKYIIVAKDAESGKYYALTINDVNAATSAGVEVVVSGDKLYNPTNDVIFGAREHTYTSGDSAWTGIGFYESEAGKCLHLNNSKIRVTTSATNGVFSFAAGTAENSFTMLGDVNTRYLTFTGTNFGVNASAGSDLYFFYQACEHEVTYVSGAKEATCAAAGSTGTVKCSWCAAVVEEATEIPALGHTMDYSNPIERIEPTCTEDGAYTFECSVCGEKEVVTMPATGHSESFSDNGDGTHSGECCVCLEPMSQSVPHAFVDGVCVCGAIEEVTPVEPTVDTGISFGSQLVLASDLTMTFRMKPEQLTKYDLSTMYIVVERDIYGTDGSVTVDTQILTEYTTGSRLVFTYSGISAAQMNDEIRAVLHIKDAEGNDYVSTVFVTTVTKYLNDLIIASSNNAKLMTLIIDMLNYGTAAQVYFNRHADAPANLAYENFITYADCASVDLTTALESMKTVTANEGATGTMSIGLDLGTRIGIQYKVTLPAGVDAANAVLVISDASGNVMESIDLSTGTVDARGRYVVNFYGLAARQMRDVVTATAYVDGVAVTATYTYSISTYAYEVAVTAGMPANLVNLTKAMVIYGDSATAYFGG